MTIKETIKKGMIELKTNGIEEPNLKSRLLMQYILNKPRQYLLVHDNETLTLRQEVNYFKGIKRLIERIPIQHITHMQEFMKMNFFVNEDLGIFFFAFSDKISSSTSGYSVITFYLTFILIIGNYIRNFFSGQAEKINLTEMPNPEEIINLCEGILASRHSFDFVQEEELYYVLMEIMRSPDYLKILTNSSIDQFKKRRNMTLKEK